MKKFEEGVFSDLRNLKPGVDASLEEPKSPFLDLLFKYQCIRTQKKQKVFYWFSVPHDRLFLDALERDLKREKMGQEPTTKVIGEPALSFTYDERRGLYEQFIASVRKDGMCRLHIICNTTILSLWVQVRTHRLVRSEVEQTTVTMATVEKAKKASLQTVKKAALTAAVEERKDLETTAKIAVVRQGGGSLHWDSQARMPMTRLG